MSFVFCKLGIGSIVPPSKPCNNQWEPESSQDNALEQLFSVWGWNPECQVSRRRGTWELRTRTCRVSNGKATVRLSAGNGKLRSGRHGNSRSCSQCPRQRTPGNMLFLNCCLIQLLTFNDPKVLISWYRESIQRVAKEQYWNRMPRSFPSNKSVPGQFWQINAAYLSLFLFNSNKDSNFISDRAIDGFSLISR